MEQSHFIQWINDYFAGIVTGVVTTLNGTKDEPSRYLFTRMLRPQLSVTGKWESLSGAYTNVMADYVAMDSPLPLKSRDSMGGASGDIPKLGLEMWLNEAQLSELDLLKATGGTKGELAKRIFEDTPRVITGHYERNEYMFLKGLSEGITVADTDNTGIGVRVDYKYLTANKFGVGVLWSSPSTSKVIDDIQRVLKKADDDGNTINVIMLDQYVIDNFMASAQAKEYYALSLNFVGASAPAIPDEDTVLSLFRRRFKVPFIKVTKKSTFEKNGSKTTLTPWAEGRMIFLTSPNVGDLVYAKTAEQNNPVPKVAYQMANQYILVSKFRENRPTLKEVTNAQARAVPVINNVQQIYWLDTKTVQA